MFVKHCPESIINTYNVGYYFTGDGALRDENGHYRITGRVDDVINISGHRLGTAEIEDALVSYIFTFKIPKSSFYKWSFLKM